MVVSYGCHSKVQPAGWLKTTNLSFTSWRLEVWLCWQGHTSSEVPREESSLTSFWFLVVAGSLQGSLVCGYISPILAFVITWPCSSWDVSDFKSLFSLRVPVIRFRAPPTQYYFTLVWNFQITSHSSISKVRNSTHLFWGHNSTHKDQNPVPSFVN